MLKINLSVILSCAFWLYGSAASAAITAFAEDFEILDASSDTALSDQGWLVFFNVYSGFDGTFLFGQGFFPAPNATANGNNIYSAVVAGEGDVAQGAQQLSIFSDYNNSAHASSDVVESIFLQQVLIDASNVGQTWVFRFDYKKGDLEPPSTAYAFIQTVDPAYGFMRSNYVTHETTAAPATWTSGAEISLTIDAELVGSYFQVGFVNTATDFDASSIIYDNLVLVAELDSDGDGLSDSTDNCTTAANPSQEDADGDLYGNACDADFNNDCVVNTIDLGQLKQEFFGSSPLTDLNGDGFSNFADLGLFKSQYLAAPGPSGLTTECDAQVPGTD